MKKSIFITFCGIVLTNISALAQQPLHYWQNPEAMLQAQATLLFTQAHTVLDSNPPSYPANNERKLALFSIDALLHDTRLDNSDAFLAYIQSRYRHVSTMLKKERPTGKEIRIYKLYNHGFVIQSPSVTIGIDIIRGGPAQKPFVGDSVIEAVVSQCDILFVSHLHGDHADKSVAQIFCNQNKSVVAPPGLWEELSPKLNYLREEHIATKKIPIQGKNVVLTVKVFPGHQDAVPNNLYAVTTPEGITVMHTGDQYNKEDMAWITQVGNNTKVDVLIIHSWIPELEKTVESIKPQLMVVGHENEMEHSIDHRESYWLSFRRFNQVITPYMVMAWGESCTYRLEAI